MKTSIISIILICGLVSCQKTNSETITLDFEKDLFPEGFAIDSRSGKMFLNSLNHNKIVSCNLDGSNPSNFIESNQYGCLSGFGMTVKGDTLYALSNSLTKKDNRSVLLLLNVKSHQLIDSYTIDDANFIYLNDLAVSSNNEIFITDSESTRIYRIQRPSKKIEVFLDSEEVAHSNGITISDDNQYLYLASTKGIRIIDIKSKKVLNTVNKQLSGVDGLKFYKNNLFGIVNAWDSNSPQNGFFKFHLNEQGTAIMSNEKIISFGKEFKLPTTFDIFKGKIYFIINTQIDNFSETTNQVLDASKLEPYRLMRFDFEN
jgi:SMP-30/Gluconolactonase/LRE-like region